MNPIRNTVKRLSTLVMACLATVAFAATAQAHSQPPHVGEAGPITINEVGKASPYPSQIVVSNILGTIERASVQLDGFTHGYPDDLDILLVSPTGKGIVLMSDAGGQADLNGASLTFTNGAPALPDESPISSGGKYRPTDYETGDALPDTTATSTGTDFGVLTGDSPNGTWRLYVLDDQVVDGGMIGTWTLILSTTPIVAVTNLVEMVEDTPKTVNVTVRDSDTDPATLTLSATSSDQTIVTNKGGFTFGGSGENRTLTITPVANQSGTITVTLGVNDGLATITTNITVVIAARNDPPTATISTNNLNIAQGTLSTNLQITVSDIDSSVNTITLNGRSENEAIVDNDNIYFGGTGANRTVAIAPTGAATGATRVFIDVIDSAGASNTITLNVTVTPVAHVVVANTATIIINDNTTATPYPSVINVSGVSGRVGEVTVSLADLTHPSPEDLDVLLVHTNASGTNAVILMRGAGGDNAVSDVRLTFDQDSATPVPQSTQISTATYQPADYLAHEGSLPAPATPAPGGTYSVNLSAFDGMDPNGQWFLFIRDNQSGASGTLQGGWLLNIYPAPTIGGVPAFVTTTEDASTSFNYTVADSDGSVTNVMVTSNDSSMFTVSKTPANNNNAISGGTVTVTPVLNQFGTNTATITVMDTSGFTTSQTFEVRITPVNDIPTMSVIPKQIVRAGSAVGPVGFTIGDVETASSSLTVTASSSNQKLIPNSNIIIEGTGANRTFTLYPIGNQAGLVNVTLTVTDGAGATFSRTFELTVQEPGSPLYENNTPITINDNTTANPYPSSITISNLVGTISEVRVSLFGVTHPSPDDIDILLVGPGGTRQVVLMSDAGDAGALTDAQLRIFDAATNAFPDNSAIVSGEYRPTDYETGDTFPSRPPGTIDPTLGTFNGSSPNGEWRLYVLDDSSAIRGGIISGGWQLSIRTAPTIATIGTQETQEDEAKRVNVVIGDQQPGATNIVVTVTTNNSPTVNLVKSIEISGSGASRTLLITPTANTFGTNTITVNVTDGSNSDSESFMFIVRSVNDAPVLSAISDRTTSAGTSTGPISFTFGDVESANSAITLTATSSNTDLVPNSNIRLDRNNTTGIAQVTILPAGIQTGQTEITVTAADPTGLKTTETFILTVSRALAFSNNGRITINDATTATPYPSTITVSGVEGAVTGVRVALLGFSHTYPDDVDIMLVSPSGNQRVMLMSDAGGPAAVTNLRLDFDQDAANPIPDSTQLQTGVWRPADYAGEFSEGTDVFPAPAPGNSTSSSFSAFTGVTANGDWRLFVRDDTFSEAGQITDGWILILETGPILDAIPAQTTREDTLLTVPITLRDSDTVASNLVVTATASENSTPNLVVASNIKVVGTQNNRTIEILPSTNLFGTNLMTVTVSDGDTTTSRSFALTVTAVNDLPVITTSTNRVVAPEDTARTIVFTVTDVDSASMLTNVSIVSSNPTLVPNSTNNLTIVSNANQNFSVTVTPAANQSGSTDLTFTALDTNRTESASFTVRFEVEPVNDAPVISGITNQVVSVIAGSATTNINFTVGDVETPARNLVVTAFSDNQTLAPNSNIQIGGSAETRTIQVTTIGTQPGSAQIGVVVNDGTVSRTNFFTVQATQAPGFTFENSSAITIRDNNTAQAYPSTIVVSSMRGPIHSVSVIIDGLTHTAPDDLDILLVSPTGQKVVLMSDAGGRTAVSNVRLRFTERGTAVPDESELQSGTYVATNFEGVDPFAAPAPAGPYADNLSVLDGANANGTWSLYIMDDAAVHSGTVSFGWKLEIETAPSITLVTSTPVNFPEDTTGTVTVTLDDMVTPVTGLTLAFDHTNGSVIKGVTTVTNGNNVTLTITPVANASGTNTMTVTVRRSDGAQSSVAVPMNVTPVNDVQTISRLTDKTTDEGVPITFEFLISDVDNPLSTLWLQATSGNTAVISHTNLLFYGSTNHLKGVPSELVSFTLRPNQFGTGSSLITVTLTDTNNSVVVSSNFTLNVTPFNDPPTISAIPTHAIPSGTSTTNIVFTVGDVDSGTLTVVASSTDTNLVRNSDIVITPVTGAPGSRTVRVTSQPGVEGSTTITLTVSDGSKTAKSAFVVNVRPSRERLFSNTRNVTMNDNGPASEYPSTINVSDLAGTVSKVTVTLNGLAHRYPDDIDMLLVSPSGQKVVLMSDAGGGVPVTNLVVKFDQTSDTQIPNDSLTSGTFRPANYESLTDTFAAPAPGSPYSVNLADFNGQNPNGTWSLYMMDDTPSDAGALVGGWTLSITTGPRIVSLQDLTILEDTTGRTTFTVAEESFASTNFTFAVSSSNTGVVANNGVTISPSSGTNYTVSVTPVANASGTSTVTLTMTNADGQVVTDQFVVTVTPVNDQPTITQVEDQVFSAGTTSGVIGFGYNDVETENKNLTFTVQSTNTDLIPVGNVQIVGDELRITPVGNRTGTSEITLTVSDGTLSNSTTFLVTVTPSSTPVYANTAGIIITDNAAGAPYPSTITVADRSGTVTKVTVTLSDVNHLYPDDVDILLVGPDGQKVILMSDAGAGGTAETRLTNARLTFDDAAASALSDNSAITNGTYKPTNYEAETFRAPAPAGPYATTLSAFVGGNPNGTWSLYVQDDASPDAGNIGSWLLSIQTTAPTISSIDNVNLIEGGSTNITFRIDDGNTAAANLTVTATTGTGRVISAQPSGTGINRTVTVTSIGTITASDTVTVTVSDGTTSASSTFTVNVEGVNNVPVITGLADASTPANTVLRMPFTVVDPEGNDVTVTTVIARQHVGTVSIEGSGANRTLVFTPSGLFPTNSTVIVVANDGAESTSQNIVLSVTAPAQPTISDIPTQNLREDIDETVTFTVTSPSGNPGLSVSASNAGLFSDLVLGGSGTTRTLRFVLAPNQSGTSSVTITASDSFGTATETFTVNVEGVNDPVTIAAIPDVATTTASTTVSVPITVSDIDTAIADMTFQALPSNIDLVRSVTFTRTATGAIANFTLAANMAGESFVTIVVRDGNTTASDTFTLTVTEEVNEPVTITPIPDVTTTTASTTVSVPITVSDVDTAIEDMTFDALPSNIDLVRSVTFTRTATGAIATFTLATNMTGESFVTILVRDGKTTASDTFTLTVTERRADPATLAVVLAGNNVNINVTGTVGATYAILGTTDFQTWIPVGNVTIDSDGTSTLTLPTSGRMMYFRAQAQ